MNLQKHHAEQLAISIKHIDCRIALLEETDCMAEPCKQILLAGYTSVRKMYADELAAITAQPGERTSIPSPNQSSK